ncbi:DedA family protein [Acidisphaera sp. S103]|uniref:DedA family protein n=1 Tax=Acidisphaera sp. S103 TaxID=1747223 RepID=UPI00131C02BC|nr:VTT domain-containing protein [Acidisphaera sp. S103]
MTLDTFLIVHGSALILPLAVIEGPIVTIVTGFLSAQGYFNWYWALPLLMCGDVIGDIGYYWVGRAGVGPLGRLGRLFGVRDALAPALQRDLARQATRMWLIGKWTHTMGGVVLVGSGMLRLPLSRFILVNLLATIPKSAVLFGAGFFFGDHYPFLERHIVASIVALGIIGASSIVLTLRRPNGIGAGP